MYFFMPQQKLLPLTVYVPVFDQEREGYFVPDDVEQETVSLKEKKEQYVFSKNSLLSLLNETWERATMKGNKADTILDGQAKEQFINSLID